MEVDCPYQLELNGKQYLPRHNPAMFPGSSAYAYSFFTLDGRQKKIVQANTLKFDINGFEEYPSMPGTGVIL